MGHLGLGIESLISIVKGKHPFCFYLKKSKSPSIILGEKFNFSKSSELVYNLFNLNSLPYLNYNNIVTLRTQSSSVSFSEVGINSYTNDKKFDILFLIGIDDVKSYRLLNPNSFIIYVGSHFSVYNLDKVDLILPSSIFLEKDFKVINLENIVKSSKSLHKYLTDTRSEWYFLLVLFSYFSHNINYQKFEKKSIFNRLFGLEYSFLLKSNIKLPTFSLNLMCNNFYKSEVFHHNIFNFYEDNF